MTTILAGAPKDVHGASDGAGLAERQAGADPAKGRSAEGVGLLPPGQSESLTVDEAQPQAAQRHGGTGAHAALASASDRAAAPSGDWQAVYMQAKRLVATNQPSQAIDVLHQAMDAPDPAPQVVILWTQLVAEVLEMPELAARRLRQMLARPNAGWAVWMCLGKAAGQLQASRVALEAHQRAVAMAPKLPLAWLELSAALRHAGDMTGAQQAAMRASDIDPADPRALQLAGHATRGNDSDVLAGRIHAALTSVATLAPSGRVHLLYAAAHLHEQSGDTGTAFRHYQKAGAVQKQLQPWSEAPARAMLHALRNRVTSADYAELRARGYASPVPVLVCGMPRSGTTLVEQILAGHPMVASVGETRLAPRAIDGLRLAGLTLRTMPEASPAQPAAAGDEDAAQRGNRYVASLLARAAFGWHRASAPSRVVDKLPDNYRWIGLIDSLAPGSRFLHCRRHPVATCLSQYRLHFGDRVPWSYDLRDLGKAYRLYVETMAFWRSLVPGDRLMDIRYEDVVADLEGCARQIVRFVDLPWDDHCLKFGAAGRWVRTASAKQVRQPLDPTRVSDWRRDMPYLGPLLEELGPLVASYEAELEQARQSNPPG